MKMIQVAIVSGLIASRVSPRYGSHDAWAAGCKMGEGAAVSSAGG
jgi:hypothetical protein